MVDCVVEKRVGSLETVLMHSSIMKGNTSDFVDIIEDYSPIPQDGDYPGGSVAEWENSGSNEPLHIYWQKRSLELLKTKSMTDLGNLGWKMYDYIESALGLRESGSYEPKFEEGSSRDCVECVRDSSNGGLLKRIDILNGFRCCGLCSQTYCYNHCSYKRKLVSTSEKETLAQRRLSIDLDPEHSAKERWIFVCQKCFEKGEKQELGQTKDHSSAFVKLRAKKKNVSEQRQDKILRNLEKLSKQTPPQGDAFSIWNALPSAQQLLQVGDSTKKFCTICEAQFSFWLKYQTCQLCSSICCTGCCNYTIPLTKSIINPNGPADRQGEVLVCKACFQLINIKKERIKFSQLRCSEESTQMMKQYEYIIALKGEIDKQLADYLEKTEILDSAILDHFELVPKNKIEQPSSVSFSEPIRNGSQQQFEQLIPLFAEYQQNVNKLLEMPAPTKRAKQVLNHMKVAFQKSEAVVLLSEKISNYSKEAQKQ